MKPPAVNWFTSLASLRDEISYPFNKAIWQLSITLVENKAVISQTMKAAKLTASPILLLILRPAQVA